jgi:Pyruvate/2-oxoacid:ferredoxin oxidoreductase delta subunit
VSGAAPTILARARADHRPERDPACAGCLQLGLLRALRRAGVPADGRLSCEPGAGLLLAAASRGEARLLVLAGPDEPSLEELPGDLAITRVERIDPGALAAVEEAVQRGLGAPGVTALVAVAPCLLGAARSAPLAVLASRCNRCGGCLSLGCPALSDPGGEAVVLDPAVCTGCGLCAPLCRGRAIVPSLTPVPGWTARPA